ncbi:hypothetical protein RJ640_007751 [Escallonia rubra]|uniref:Uncharacterized protein n=1 Tax=Escallonia rubra TaxID=112253 RepID=A0AA88RE72_9ASTE|nr:hypothetical protein RJ640_007751 [Escallonia rubra]
MVRTPCFDKNGLKKGAWSKEEDDKLRAYIQRYGHWNWRQLPKFAGLPRCGKSCRLRWMNYLRPNVKRGNYSKEEEDLILKLHDDLGNKWSAMAEKLPGRTDNEIKNYWHTHLKKRAKSNPKEAQVIEQSASETSPHILSDSPSQQTSESNPLPAEQTSSGSVSSSYCDYAVFSGLNWAAEDSINSFESYCEPIQNFWTEPFLLDTSFEHWSDLVEGEIMPSYYYNYGIELFNQTIEEMEAIYLNASVLSNVQLSGNFT